MCKMIFNSIFRVGDNYFKLRLEPIVDLNNQLVIGYELLSRPITYIMDGGNILLDVDELFKKMNDTHLLIVFKHQVSWLSIMSEINMLHNECYYSINIPIHFLDSDVVISYLVELSVKVKVCVEIEIFNHNTRIPYDNISILMKSGVKLWLDDCSAVGSVISKVEWHAVKIDKNKFWELKGVKGLKFEKMIDRINRKCDIVIIEGVETKKDLDFALQTKASYGQGFLWPSI
ncbi:EAL domain-containing protein [Aeromonas jandaei]|uniref:EAL domain-containing protein n=1 Tax=Aeromonas jandaei TaxID=650 RepID=UPI001C5A9E8D|nr:EAL domain-containing protein [Aeromonas jandaei]MBW3804460.1 EAL domain-containing protein [Aeromonas jandaei]